MSNLTTILVPDPDKFFILLPENQKTGIEGYYNIFIDFSHRFYVYNNKGKKETIQPFVRYDLMVSSAQKKLIETLWKNSLDEDKLHSLTLTKETNIEIGETYVFRGKVTMNTYIKSGSVWVEIGLDHLDPVDLYKGSNEECKKYLEQHAIKNRFEIMDLL